MRFSVEPAGPYSLARTAARFSRFPEVVDRFDGEAYRRLLLLGRDAVLLTVEQAGPPARARLHVTLSGPGADSSAAKSSARGVLARSLGCLLDVRPFYRAFRKDPLLGSPIRRFSGLTIAGAPSLWEALVTAVLCQQVNLVFAYDIRRELALAYGRKARFAGEDYIAFPTPERIARAGAEGLTGFRLSRAKGETLLRLATDLASGTLAEAEVAALPDAAAIERLMAIKGIGRWTAEIALLRGLGRSDVFPAGDLGVVKYLAQGLLGHSLRATEPEMRRFAEAWQPYRGLALVYAYAELDRLKKLKP